MTETSTETAIQVTETQLTTPVENPVIIGQTARSSWKFSTDKMRSYITHYSAHEKQVLVDCYLWCVRKDIHRDDFAKRIGYDGNTVYKVYVGKYFHPTTKARLGPPEKMIKGMENFLKDEKNKMLLGVTEFVETPTAKKIAMGCKLARESQTPVFIFGRSHIGKTWALQNYAINNNHGRTIYVQMKTSTGLLGMIHAIAVASGISPKSNKHDLIGRIKKAFAPNQVLIVDELHKLRNTYSPKAYFACLELLREFYDEIGFGMVLCGTDLFKNVISEEKNGELEQLYRRGVHKFYLPPHPTLGDVKAVITHNGLEWPAKDMIVRIGKIVESPYEILRVKSREEGLKAITERLRYARKIGGGTISWETFVKAHLSIVSEDQSELDDWE